MVPTCLAYLTINFTKFLKFCRQPVQQLMAAVVPILHPTALPMVEVEPGNLVNYHKSGRRRSHHQSEGRKPPLQSYQRMRMGEGWKKWRAARPFGMIASWNHHFVGSNTIAKKEVKSHCKYETTRRTALPEDPGNASGFPCKFTLCHAVAIDHAQELSHEDPGVVDDRVCTCKVRQEIARFLRSVSHMHHSKMLSVICLDEMHLCAGCIHLMVYL